LYFCRNGLYARFFFDYFALFKAFIDVAIDKFCERCILLGTVESVISNLSREFPENSFVSVLASKMKFGNLTETMRLETNNLAS